MPNGPRLAAATRATSTSSDGVTRHDGPQDDFDALTTSSSYALRAGRHRRQRSVRLAAARIGVSRHRRHRQPERTSCCGPRSRLARPVTCDYLLLRRFVPRCFDDGVGRGRPARRHVSTSLRTFARLPLSMPPLVEQRAIADFLDAETARIDALIAARSGAWSTCSRSDSQLQRRRSAFVARAARIALPLTSARSLGIAYGIVLTPSSSVTRTGVPIADSVDDVRPVDVDWRRSSVDDRPIETISGCHSRSRVCDAGDVVVRCETGRLGAAAVVPRARRCNCIDRAIVRSIATCSRGAWSTS